MAKSPEQAMTIRARITNSMAFKPQETGSGTSKGQMTREAAEWAARLSCADSGRNGSNQKSLRSAPRPVDSRPRLIQVNAVDLGPHLRFQQLALPFPLFLPISMGGAMQQQFRPFEQAVRELNTAVMEAFNRGDVRTCVNSYAEDATLFLPGRPPLKGRDSIESFLRAYATLGAKLLAIELCDVLSNDGMGCCTGRYEFVFPSKNGTSTKESGKFVTVFMCQADGSWKAVVDSLLAD